MSEFVWSLSKIKRFKEVLLLTNNIKVSTNSYQTVKECDFDINKTKLKTNFDCRLVEINVLLLYTVSYHELIIDMINRKLLLIITPNISA